SGTPDLEEFEFYPSPEGYQKKSRRILRFLLKTCSLQTHLMVQKFLLEEVEKGETCSNITQEKDTKSDGMKPDTRIWCELICLDSTTGTLSKFLLKGKYTQTLT
ncbi:hypothetical protein RUM43_011427, partial [Polyplax serrata]